MSDKKYRNGGNITLNENGETITDASRVSEIFNDFFVNVATDIGFNDDVVSASDAIKRHDQHPSVKRIREYYQDKIKDFDFHVVDTETVMHMIKNINPRKATGCDNIPGKLIRIAYREISIPICSLLNASIAAKRFPSIMKYADVSPCFKKEDNLFKGNYRPVSVLTVISKLYESVLNNQMVDHLSELFNILLSAFRKHYNCQSLLLKLIEDIKSALDKGHKTGAVFMDLSKAFDCLPHALLLAKLNAYGLSTAACELMSSYLNQRMQRVKISNCRSSWKMLNKGVPQGSILGPLLFNVFMNDMFLFMERCNLYNYADDNSIIHSSPDIETVILNLKHDCQNAIQWFTNNGMKANPNKFQFMVISSKQMEPQNIELHGGVSITSEPSVKILGVVIDDRLNFDEHVSMCCTKAARQLNALARISKYLDFKSKTIIYNSFILSNFNYCPLAWHFCGKTNNQKLDKLQERSLRILYCDYSSHFQDLLGNTSTESILTTRIKCIVSEVFKSLYKLNAPCLHDMFKINKTSYDVRVTKLEQPLRKTTNYGLRTFSYIGSRLWNLLVQEYPEVPHIDLGQFKSLLKRWTGPKCDVTEMHIL